MSSNRNIIKVYFKGTHLIYSKSQYQYNHGMILHFADLNLPQAFEAHFANKPHGNSKTVIGADGQVGIPDEYFWSGANEIYAWVYLHSDVDDGETVYEVRIPLVKRAKPSDEEPLPEQESAINRAIAELNRAVEQTGADAEQTNSDREAVTEMRDEVSDLKDSAEESANIAMTKAQEASTSASNAEDSEQEAKGYADDAKGYAENAFSSKEIAVANASEAEQAKEDAEQARDDAQDARSDTIQLKQDVVGLKDDVITLKEQTDTNVTHYPKIVDEYWHVWDASQNAFVNTGVDAKGEDGEDGEKGDTYELTQQDKQDIAELVEVPEPLKYVKDDPSDNGGVIEGFVDTEYSNRATGIYSHAEGTSTKATNENSHAEGSGTTSSGIDSHAENSMTTASGDSSHAEGIYSVASGLASHAEGVRTIAQRANQHVSGTYNVADTGGNGANSKGTYAFIIGNGTSENNRSNACTLDWNGNGVYAGKLTVGTAPTADMDVATKKYVDDIKGASIHICSSGEYDSTTGIPTIQNPDERTFYLVPNADGTSPDLFVEWAYINNAWEMFGSASIDLSNYVTNTDIATANKLGIVKPTANQGISINSDGGLKINFADLTSLKSQSNSFYPVTPTHIHEATFYGLAKASGDTTQSQSDNTVGTYTDEAKASIQTMLGVPSSDDVVSDVQINGTSVVNNGVATIPPARTNSLGLVKMGQGLSVNEEGALFTAFADSNRIKAENTYYMPITPVYQHVAVFYGLAHASGDTTQKASRNAVGQYTDEAKTAIKQMLGVVDSYDSLVVNVTGTDPVITAQPSYRYNCGEVTSLTITPPTSGTIDFIFTSGTTPTVLDLPNTVKMPSWWIGTEANTTYEMCITDGVYCGVMSWDA